MAKKQATPEAAATLEAEPQPPVSATTKLIVRPIDLSGPGSYLERRRVLRAFQAVQGIEGAGAAEAIGCLLELDDLVRERLATSDGSSVEDALARLSANQFDELMKAIAFQGQSVPTPTASN